jgi:hypothetical protein
MDLCGFCMRSVQDSCSKLLILLENITDALFLRCFERKSPIVKSPVLSWALRRMMRITNKLVLFMLSDRSSPI